MSGAREGLGRRLRFHQPGLGPGHFTLLFVNNAPEGSENSFAAKRILEPPAPPAAEVECVGGEPFEGAGYVDSRVAHRLTLEEQTSVGLVDDASEVDCEPYTIDRYEGGEWIEHRAGEAGCAALHQRWAWEALDAGTYRVAFPRSLGARDPAESCRKCGIRVGAPHCGDGVLDEGEQCDGGRGCEPDCRRAPKRLGDGDVVVARATPSMCCRRFAWTCASSCVAAVASGRMESSQSLPIRAVSRWRWASRARWRWSSGRASTSSSCGTTGTRATGWPRRSGRWRHAAGAGSTVERCEGRRWVEHARYEYNFAVRHDDWFFFDLPVGRVRISARGPRDRYRFRLGAPSCGDGYVDWREGLPEHCDHGGVPDQDCTIDCRLPPSPLVMPELRGEVRHVQFHRYLFSLETPSEVSFHLCGYSGRSCRAALARTLEIYTWPEEVYVPVAWVADGRIRHRLPAGDYALRVRPQGEREFRLRSSIVPE